MITKNIQAVKTSLENGDVVGIPTETVYGLAANAFNKEAIQKIFSLKNRPFSNPLILHTHSIDEIKKYIQPSSYEILEIAKKYWPGPLTILAEKKEIIDTSITAGSNYVAFRIPNHPLLRSLLESLPFPLAAPSANPYQKVSPTSADIVYAYFEEKIPFILDGGKCDCGIESTIIGMKDEQIIVYRQGAISLEEIKQNGKDVVIVNKNEKMIPTSGMSKKHYSPKTKFIVVESIHQFIQENKDLKIGVLDFQDQSLKAIAKNYYSKLYELDQNGFDVIIAQHFEDVGIGRALNDKLQRGSYKN